MKTQIIKGMGIQGINLTLSVCDMFAANQMADKLKAIIDNHKEVDKYMMTPYDKRKELFPNGEPQRKHLITEDVDKLLTLLCKMSFAATSTIFEDEDEPNGADNDEESDNMFEEVPSDMLP